MILRDYRVNDWGIDVYFIYIEKIVQRRNGVVLIWLIFLYFIIFKLIKCFVKGFVIFIWMKYQEREREINMKLVGLENIREKKCWQGVNIRKKFQKR